MKIKITDFDDTLILHDDGLNNIDYVNIIVEDDLTSTGMCVSLAELESAVKAFINLRDSSRKRDKMLSNE